MKGSKAIVKIVRGIPRFCKRNSNWILSALAMIGVTGLTWAAIKGTIKAVKLCEEKGVKDGKEVIKTTWKLYIPALGFFILTTLSIVGNAHINGKRLATLTGLYAASQADIQAIKKKAKEMLGEKKASEVQAEADKEKVAALPAPKEGEINQTGHGTQLYMDGMTGQFFRASPDYIELVEKEINMKLQNEVDNLCYRAYLQERFHERDCGTKEMFWDLLELNRRGIKEVKLDASFTGWMDINGQKEVVAVLHCDPEPTDY